MLLSLIYKQSTKLKNYNVIYRLGFFLNITKKVYYKNWNKFNAIKIYDLLSKFKISNIITPVILYYENTHMFNMITPNSDVYLILLAKRIDDFSKLAVFNSNLVEKKYGVKFPYTLFNILNCFHNNQYKLLSELFYKFIRSLIYECIFIDNFMYIVFFDNKNDKSKYIIFSYDIQHFTFYLKVIYDSHELIEIRNEEKSIMHCSISYNQYYKSNSETNKYNMTFTRHFTHKY